MVETPSTGASERGARHKGGGLAGRRGSRTTESDGHRQQTMWEFGRFSWNWQQLKLSDELDEVPGPRLFSESARPRLPNFKHSKPTIGLVCFLLERDGI